MNFRRISGTVKNLIWTEISRVRFGDFGNGTIVELELDQVEPAVQ